jgi:hypothetical protein
MATISISSGESHSLPSQILRCKRLRTARKCPPLNGGGYGEQILQDERIMGAKIVGVLQVAILGLLAVADGRVVISGILL